MTATCPSFLAALAATAVAALVAGCASSSSGRALADGAAASPTPAEARAIAKEAWLYAYAPLQGYKTMYNQTQNRDFAGYVGGFDRFRHYARLNTPADTDIVTPNNDTPYSWAWLDLRAEPMVVSLPAVPAPRYYVNQWFDLHTHNFAYTGVRATGRDAGHYLFAGPRWNGEVPKGITKVFRAETDFVGTLTRTQLDGQADLAAMQAVQAQYTLTPLSRFAGTPAPAPAPAIAWPRWDEEAAMGIGCIGSLNFLLQFMPVVASEQAMFARFARIGIGAGKPFDATQLDPAMRAAIAAGMAESAEELKAKALAQTSSKGFFGTREELGEAYQINRSMGAMLGIYGNSIEEAVYASQQTGPDGKVLDGAKHWVLRFEPGALPPCNEFWSITMYGLPDRFLVENPIQRYSVGDRTEGLRKGADGSLEIYIQHDRPDGERASNWLPAPKGPFFVVARLTGPSPELIAGTWALPALRLAD
ncbi:MAG: DUF1254 domain-containing protein [Planctomycetota bacterium]